MFGKVFRKGERLFIEHNGALVYLSAKIEDLQEGFRKDLKIFNGQYGQYARLDNMEALDV